MDTGGERVFHFPRLTSCNRGRRTSMTTGWRALGVVLTVGTTIPASAQELATWRPVETAPAAAHLAELLPAGAYTVDARAGDLLRLVGGSRPTVGRLWRSGDAYAFVDESDRLVPDGSAWRFLVPLGTHELVVVAGARRAERVGVARATRVTVGYEWEVYEDALVDWGDGASTAPPPAPPSGSAGAAWSEADAVSTLLADAGALDRGGRSLRTAVALDGVARARAMVGPYYREAGRALVRVVEPGTPTSAKLRGPLLVRVTARSARPAGRQVAARVRVDGLPVVAADAPVGPSGPAELPGALGPPVELTARIPAGEHLVSVEALGGPAHVTVEPFRKRHHVADAFSGDESIDGRARALMAAGAPIVAAEARRLGGDLAGARAAFIRLEGASSPAVRVLAAWRAAELATDADDAAAAFNRAMSAAAQLSAGSRDRVVPALAAARLRRAAVDGEPASRAAADVAALAALWTDPRAAAALAEGAGSVDRGEAVARLAAAVAAEPFDAGALRRAFFDRTVWSGAAESSRAEQLVLVRDDDQGACADVDRTAIGYLRVGDRPLTVEVPADPLGSSRFLTGRVAAFAPDGPALEAELLVDGQPVPLPVVAAAATPRSPPTTRAGPPTRRAARCSGSSCASSSRWGARPSRACSPSTAPAARSCCASRRSGGAGSVRGRRDLRRPPARPAGGGRGARRRGRRSCGGRERWRRAGPRRRRPPAAGPAGRRRGARPRAPARPGRRPPRGR